MSTQQYVRVVSRRGPSQEQCLGYLYVSDQLLDLIGVTREEILNKTITIKSHDPAALKLVTYIRLQTIGIVNPTIATLILTGK